MKHYDPDKHSTEYIADRLEDAIEAQHEMVDEVKALRTSSRNMRVVAVILGAVAIISLFAAVRSFALASDVEDAVVQIEETREESRIETCRSRNSSLRSLRATQLESSLETVDALLAGLDAASGPTPERTALAEDVKARLIQEAADEEANPVVPDQDCDRDGTPGGTDDDDYVNARTILND